MTIHEKYSITEEETILTQNSFFKSIEIQFADKQKLSPKQEQSLMNMLERTQEHQDLLDMETFKANLALKNYYRFDYHGDALSDSVEDGLYKNLTEDQIKEQLQDAHAAQYGATRYEDLYTESNTKVELPFGLSQEEEDRFAIYRGKDFTQALKKLRSNKFRKVSTKNRTIQIIRELLAIDDIIIPISEEDHNFLFGIYRNW